MLVHSIQTRPREKTFIWWGKPCRWRKPKELKRTDVFVSRKTAEEWAQKNLNVKPKNIRFISFELDDISKHNIMGDKS